jgi:hypothetical protein
MLSSASVWLDRRFVRGRSAPKALSSRWRSREERPSIGWQRHAAIVVDVRRHIRSIPRDRLGDSEGCRPHNAPVHVMDLQTC